MEFLKLNSCMGSPIIANVNVFHCEPTLGMVDGVPELINRRLGRLGHHSAVHFICLFGCVQ